MTISTRQSYITHIMLN